MTIVIKYGGHAMGDPAARAAFAADVAALRGRQPDTDVGVGSGPQPDTDVGVGPAADLVVVHGGGPQITARLRALNMTSVFVAGRRVTTAEAMRVVRDVLAEVNADVVRLLGPSAAAVPGEAVFTAAPLDPAFGYVGDVTAVDPAAIRATLDQGRVPVVTSVATGADGALYNVNADTAAAALAVALGAGKVVFLTDVAGLYLDYAEPDSLVASVTADEVESLLPALSDGMVPKMEACLRAVRGGVPVAHVLDGRVPHALRDDTTGTLVSPC